MLNKQTVSFAPISADLTLITSSPKQTQALAPQCSASKAPIRSSVVQNPAQEVFARGDAVSPKNSAAGRSSLLMPLAMKATRCATRLARDAHHGHAVAGEGRHDVEHFGNHLGGERRGRPQGRGARSRARLIGTGRERRVSPFRSGKVETRRPPCVPIRPRRAARGLPARPGRSPGRRSAARRRPIKARPRPAGR